MERYFFDLRDGTVERDETGTELAGLPEARREAIRFLGEVLKDEPERLAEGTLHVDVSDDRQRHLFGLRVLLDDTWPSS